MVKMKPEGWEIYKKWDKIYMAELERLQKEDPNCETGWCIIEGDDFVKTLDDVVGIMIFGYDENALGTIDEWIEEYGEDDTAYGFNLVVIQKELEKYFIWK